MLHRARTTEIQYYVMLPLKNPQRPRLVYAILSKYFMKLSIYRTATCRSKLFYNFQTMKHMNTTIFWDVTPCSLPKVYQNFG
jgi:hypothetical protein